MGVASKVTGRLVAALILVCDLIPALAWTFGDPLRSTGAAYVRARAAFDWLPGDPARWWGGLLLILVIFAFVCLAAGTELWARRAFGFLLTYWATWAFFYLWSAITVHHAGWAIGGLALIACIGHWRPIVSADRLVTYHPTAAKRQG